MPDDVQRSRIVVNRVLVSSTVPYHIENGSRRPGGHLHKAVGEVANLRSGDVSPGDLSPAHLTRRQDARAAGALALRLRGHVPGGAHAGSLGSAFQCARPVVDCCPELRSTARERRREALSPYAGHLGSKQVIPQVPPEVKCPLGSDAILNFRHVIRGSLVFAFLAHT
jgi:hypothetical protein